jgi:hypothetical protein
MGGDMEHPPDRPPDGDLDNTKAEAAPPDDDDVDWGLAWLEQCERLAGYL